MSLSLLLCDCVVFVCQFLTLFASQGGCDSFSTLQRLWDVTLIRDDPFGHYYIAVALLKLHQPFLLNTELKYLPMQLRKVQVTSTNLFELLREAQRIREKTPPSFRQTLYEVSFATTPTGGVAAAIAAASGGVGSMGAPSAVSAHVLEQLSSYSELLPCMSIPAGELVRQAYSDLDNRHDRTPTDTTVAPEDAASSPLKFIVLDCRPTSEYSAGHLPCAIHLSPSLLHIPSQLTNLLGPKGYGGMKLDCHFCFVGSQMSSLSEVSTPLPTGAASAAIVGPAIAHALHLPNSRKAVPPPSPSSSLAALAEAARADEDALKHLKSLPAALELASPSSGTTTLTLPIKNLDALRPSGADTPVLGGSVTHFPLQRHNSALESSDDLSVQVGSPSSVTAGSLPPLVQPILSPSKSPSSNSGVLYRPETPLTPLRTPVMSGSNVAVSFSPMASSPNNVSVDNGVIRSNVLLDSTTASYVSLFLSAGFPHISICEGGYPACHSLVFTAQEAYRAQRNAIQKGEIKLNPYQQPLENMELVDHNSHTCLVCNPPAPPPVLLTSPTDDTTDIPSSNTPPNVIDGKSHKLSVRKGSSSGPDGFSTPEKGTRDTSDGITHAGNKTGVNTPNSSVSVGSVGIDLVKVEKSPSSSPTATVGPVSSASTSTPSAVSRFSLGFKKLGASLSQKMNTFKEEQAAKSAAKEKEREQQAANKAAEDTKAAEAAAKITEPAVSGNSLDATTSSTRKSASALTVHTDASSAVHVSGSSTVDEKDKRGGSFGSRFLSALGVKKKDDSSSKSVGTSNVPTSEMNAAVDLAEWAADGENIALFHCHEIALYPIRTPSGTTGGTGAVTTPTTPAKRQGVLLPRVLVVTAGYVITFQPAVTKAVKPATPTATSSTVVPPVVRSTSSADDVALAAAAGATAAPFGLAFLKSKHRLIDLERITSKKDRPSVLTFHWKPLRETDAGPAPPIHIAPSSSTTETTSSHGGNGEMLTSPSPLPSPSSLAATGGFDGISLQTPSTSFLPHMNYPMTSPTSSVTGNAVSPQRRTTSSVRGPTTMFLVERPKECIALVRSKFLLAKASAALAESNRRVLIGNSNNNNHISSRSESDAVVDAPSEIFNLNSNRSGNSVADSVNGTVRSESFDREHDEMGASAEHDVSEPPSPNDQQASEDGPFPPAVDTDAAPRLSHEPPSTHHVHAMLSPSNEDLLDL
jgi:rhodanese-related sulfurtransferase